MLIEYLTKADRLKESKVTVSALYDVYAYCLMSASASEINYTELSDDRSRKNSLFPQLTYANLALNLPLTIYRFVSLQISIFISIIRKQSRNVKRECILCIVFK